MSVARECDCTEPGPAPPASTAAQRLAAATGGSTTPQHRRVLGVCAYMPPRATKLSGRQLMILFDDGTLQLFDRPDCEPADVSLEEDDDEDDEDEDDENLERVRRVVVVDIGRRGRGRHEDDEDDEGECRTTFDGKATVE